MLPSIIGEMLMPPVAPPATDHHQRYQYHSYSAQPHANYPASATPYHHQYNQHNMPPAAPPASAFTSAPVFSPSSSAGASISTTAHNLIAAAVASVASASLPYDTHQPYQYSTTVQPVIPDLAATTMYSTQQMPNQYPYLPTAAPSAQQHDYSAPTAIQSQHQLYQPPAASPAASAGYPYLPSSHPQAHPVPPPGATPPFVTTPAGVASLPLPPLPLRPPPAAAIAVKVVAPIQPMKFVSANPPAAASVPMIVPPATKRRFTEVDEPVPKSKSHSQHHHRSSRSRSRSPRTRSRSPRHHSRHDRRNSRSRSRSRSYDRDRRYHRRSYSRSRSRERARSIRSDVATSSSNGIAPALLAVSAASSSARRPRFTEEAPPAVVAPAAPSTKTSSSAPPKRRSRFSEVLPPDTPMAPSSSSAAAASYQNGFAASSHTQPSALAVAAAAAAAISIPSIPATTTTTRRRFTEEDDDVVVPQRASATIMMTSRHRSSRSRSPPPRAVAHLELSAAAAASTTAAATSTDLTSTASSPIRFSRSRSPEATHRPSFGHGSLASNRDRLEIMDAYYRDLNMRDGSSQRSKGEIAPLPKPDDLSAPYVKRPNALSYEATQALYGGGGSESTSSHAPLDARNVGYRLLAMMGWCEGTGLGKRRNGIVEPVPVVQRPKKKGVGAEKKKEAANAKDDDFEAFRQRKIDAYNHRPNPLNNPRKPY